ncbi:MAG: YihY/virulence factor BrkB family protein [Vulcanimicrobiaceae bacterium]
MHTVIGLVRGTYDAWNADRAQRLAAALAFYVSFALAPFLIVVIQIAGLILGKSVGEQHARQELFAVVTHSAGPLAAAGLNTIVTAIMTHQGKSLLTAIASWFFVILAAGGLFGAIEDALNTVFSVPQERGGIWVVIRDRFLPFAMIGGIALLLIVTLVVNALITSLAAGLERLFPGFVIIFQVLGVMFTFFVTMFLVAIIYKVLPATTLDWRDILVGSFVTAFMFTLGEMALVWYLGRAATTSWYGALGSLVVILIWIYYCAQIFLVGAEFTKVYVRRVGSKAKAAARLTQAS